MIEHPQFKWSRILERPKNNSSNYYLNEWLITLDDFHNRKYTYYWNNIPIKNIAAPFLTGDDYVTTVGLIDDNYSSVMVDVKDIKNVSEYRNDKIDQLISI